MEHAIGRHRRPHRTLAGRLRARLAAILATALAFVLVPEPPRGARAATDPPSAAPRPPAPSAATIRPVDVDDAGDPDEVGGALVRPYLTGPPARSRPAGGGPAPQAGKTADDLGDLAALVRTYLDTVR
ncbi:hypothetical protein BJF83_21800 [Nocardiopsis sp. CNR-923]|uniref:hypothetical protein n=1 Tax=Nocardiopsis sp. CNR-923 TaxID=1904965 RepID=UPI000961E1AB|nr:hypothetical protein [Nocardiopsis sp. CNR-923]OLT26012.1 hypothetical protein BJF83_21800 [Nocardiopsis sp. CNR-923]